MFTGLRDWYMRYPRPIRKLFWWWLLPFVWMVLMTALIAVRLSAPNYAPVWFKWLEPWGMFVGQFIAMAVTIYKTRQIKRDFDTSGGRLCTQCAHNLAGLPDTGNCPECGHRYDTELDRITWSDAQITLSKKT